MTWKGFYITININKTRNNITGYNVSFVCNVTEAVPFCELLIGPTQKRYFLEEPTEIPVSTWLLATWLGTVAKMN